MVKGSTVSQLGEPQRLKLMKSRGKGEVELGSQESHERQWRGASFVFRGHRYPVWFKAGPQTETPSWATKMSHGA